MRPLRNCFAYGNFFLSLSIFFSLSATAKPCVFALKEARAWDFHEIEFARLFTPRFYKDLYKELTQDRPTPLNKKASVKDLKKEREQELEKLKELGVQLQALPSMGDGGVSNIYHYRLKEETEFSDDSPLINSLKKESFIYEVTNTPPAKIANSVHPTPPWKTRALEHPNFAKLKAQIEEAGYKLVVDTTMPFAGSGAYHFEKGKTISINSRTSYLGLLHEFVHLENAGATGKSPIEHFPPLLDFSGEANFYQNLEATFGPERTKILYKYKDLPLNVADERMAVNREQKEIGPQKFKPFTEGYALSLRLEIYATRYLVRGLQEKIRETDDKTELKALKTRLFKAQAKIKALIFLEKPDLISLLPVGIYFFAASPESNTAEEKEETQENAVSLIIFPDGTQVLSP